MINDMSPGAQTAFKAFFPWDGIIHPPAEMGLAVLGATGKDLLSVAFGKKPAQPEVVSVEAVEDEGFSITGAVGNFGGQLTRGMSEFLPI